MKAANTISLENFDDAWSLGYPEKVEEKLKELLPQAQSLENKSIYLQILSQIALAQAVQKKFNEAHATLDQAESMLTPEYDLAKARILLERGRTYQQAENIDKALKYFEKSYELSAAHNFDFHTINAAHMIAIVVKDPMAKINWNQEAIDRALKTNAVRAQAWLGSLYNNLGQNYLSINQFDRALDAFQKALKYRQKEGYKPNILVAKWAIARTLRSLGQLDEALRMQRELVKEYDTIEKSGALEMPVEMFRFARGLADEELAELTRKKSKE